MKKKLLLLSLMVLLVACALAVVASAATVYKDSQGNEMFSYEMDSSNIITSYSGSFPKTDSLGNELTWYVTSSSNDANGNTVKTVACVKTMDEAYFTLSNGKYSYGGTAGKVVTQYNVVSVNFPLDAGIETLNLENNGYKAGGYSYSPFTTELLFLYLPNTLTTLPERIVQNSKALVCDIPSDTPFTSISRVAFYHAKCLREINIPSTVEIIYSVDPGEGTAFYQCGSLEKVTFGENSVIREIQKQAFAGCTSLKEMTLPDSLQTLGVEVFYGSALVDSPFTKNSQCSSIGRNCFANIKTLKSMIIPAGIVELDAMSFMAYSSNIEWLGFAENTQLRVIKKNSFCGTSVNQGQSFSKMQMETIPDTVEIIEDYAFLGTGIVDSPFSENSICTFIGHQAFSNCVSLKEINIPKNATFVTDLSKYDGNSQKNGVFSYCTSLEKVSFQKEATVKILPTYMFAYCSSIKSITIPNSVTTLSARMFDRCTKLETIILGANVTSLNNGRAWSDGHNSFTYGCTSLKYVYLPATLDLTSGHENACHVFSTADYSGSFAKLTFFVNGTEAEAKAIQDGFKAVTSCNRNDRITNATIISLQEYNALSEINANYIVYGVNTCDAFYEGAHATGNPSCERCGEAIYCDDPTHNLKTDIVYTSFVSIGTKSVKCLDCNSTPIEYEALPLFIYLGHSLNEGRGGEVAIGFIVNKSALNEYKNITGNTVAYGVFAVLQSRLGESDIFANDGTKANGVASKEVSSYDVDAFVLKITGFTTEDQMNTPFAFGAYVSTSKDGKTEYSYIQPGVPSEGYKYHFTSFNDLIKA